MKVSGDIGHPYTEEIISMLTRKSALCSCMGLLLAATITSGCEKNPTQLGSSHVDSLEIGPEGGLIEISREESELIAGARISVPDGALDRVIKITVGIGDDPIVDATGRGIGPIVDFGPDGTTFSKPAVVTLPYQGDPNLRRMRVWVKSGSTLTSIPPHQLTVDREKKLVRFQISHFTTFQCGENNEPPPCDITECGPQPGLPNWTCPDGTLGGPTGQCERIADGTCAWEIAWCAATCDPTSCGPMPAIVAICADGTPADTVCEADAAGQCGWNSVCPNTCEPEENDPTTCPGDCTAGEVCPEGTVCIESGQCVPDGASCGTNTCGVGEYCCNESCGTCAAIGEVCPTEECSACGEAGVPCPPGQSCDEGTGTCMGGNPDCGSNTCGEGEYCCNESCGTCTAIGQGCPAVECTQCGTDPSSPACPPDQTCDASGQCVPICDPNDCGPAPGIPNWTCEDGTPGGPTGNCVPVLENGAPSCVWEIIWCTPICEELECGPQPGEPNYTCPDGTIAGPTGECRRAADGTCSWVIINCP